MCALVGELGKLKQSFPNLEQGSVDYSGLVGQIYTTSKSYAKILSGSRILQMQAIGMVQSWLPVGLGSATDSILRDISQFDESQVANIAYLLNSLMNAPAGTVTKERRLRAGLEGISKIDPASLDRFKYHASTVANSLICTSSCDGLILSLPIDVEVSVSSKSSEAP
mgnify:CR=1 FL=1